MNNLKVLIADDSKISRRLLQTALSEWQFDVIEACDGNEAWEILSREDAPRLAVLDWYMPGLEGVEICHRLRQRESAPYVYTIILTGKGDRENLIEGFESGADDFLGKPFDPEELEQRLRAGVRLLQLEDRLRETQVSLRDKNDHMAKMCETAQRFVDNVSHEFRTPLTVIKEYVSLLRDGVVGDVPLDDDQNRFLDIVNDRADDLNIMVDDMLDVSKLESGLLGTWKQTCRVDEIVGRVQPSLEKKAAIRDVTLELSIPSDLCDVYCDAEKAGRVIINLAINAIKFCQRPGLVRLWAKADADRREVVIGVTDNGPGIEEDELAKIFERFQQLDAHTGNSCKGFGLGLNIASELVGLNFGEMQVQSEPGFGSTFSFSLPMAIPQEIVSRYFCQLAKKYKDRPSLAMISARIEETTDAKNSDEVDALLNYVQRADDLLFRRDQHHWLLVAPMQECEANEVVDTIQEAVSDTNRNRPQGLLPKLHAEVEAVWSTDVDSNMIAGIVEQFLEPVGASHA